MTRKIKKLLCVRMCVIFIDLRKKKKEVKMKTSDLLKMLLCLMIVLSTIPGADSIEEEEYTPDWTDEEEYMPDWIDEEEYMPTSMTPIDRYCGDGIVDVDLDEEVFFLFFFSSSFFFLFRYFCEIKKTSWVVNFIFSGGNYFQFSHLSLYLPLFFALFKQGGGQ